MSTNTTLTETLPGARRIPLGPDAKLAPEKGRATMESNAMGRGPVSDGFARLGEAGREWLPSAIAAVATWQLTEAFLAFLLLYFPLAVWDTVLGSRGRESSSTEGRNGISSKGVSITVACVLHGVGFLAERYGIPGIPAPIGVFFVVGLLIHEARSVNRHHRRLRGEGIPYLDPALDAVEAAQDAVLGKGAGARRHRRGRK